MPNNGIRIYTENGKGIDIRNDVYKILGISPRSNGFDIGYACGNTHGKINPLSKRKPYGFGGISGYDDTDAEAENWGMTPAPMRLPDAPLWGQWQPPKGGLSQPFRPGDFNGYNHNAKAPVHVEDLFFTNNNGNRMNFPTLARRGEHYYGNMYLHVDFQIDPGDFVMSDFHPTWASSSYFKTFKPTLIFAAWEGVETRPGAVWIAQTEDYVGRLSGAYRLSINTGAPEMYAYIVGGDIKLDDEEGNRIEVDGTEQWIAAVCLAPAVRMVNSEGDIVYTGKPAGVDFMGELFSLKFSPKQSGENFVLQGNRWGEPVEVTPTETKRTLFEVNTACYNPEVVYFEAFRDEGYLEIMFSSATANYLGYTQLEKVTATAWANIYDRNGNFIFDVGIGLGEMHVHHDGPDHGHVTIETEDNAIRADASWLKDLPSGQYIMETYLYFYATEDIGFIRYVADQSYDDVHDGIYDSLNEVKDELNISPCVLFSYQGARTTINI